MTKLPIEGICQLSNQIYEEFKVPLFKFLIQKDKNEIFLCAINPFAENEKVWISTNELSLLTKGLKILGKKTASNTFKRIGCFVEGYNLTDYPETAGIRNFKQCAERKGHEFDFIFKKDIAKIPEYRFRSFIRAVTDYYCTACIVSKIANENGLKVVDDPQSIQICSNKSSYVWKLKISRRALPAHNIVFQKKD